MIRKRKFCIGNIQARWINMTARRTAEVSYIDDE
ncbi:hypothetical protein T4B_6951 [Trichinella pseudospiralis]|uniref:Uncharacterized protein n=1 Tax=Trichinella pseudospiralis TaxID=6337 RepID=A0A0V1G728_TRIPS|nr:hypothetical protein T4B_6951 [Trichinella pseudospiralis]